MSRRRIFHPFLFAVFPVLALYSQNANQLRPGVLVLPFVVALLLALVSWALFAKAGLGREKAGLLSSFLLVLFFFYGHAVWGLRALSGALFPHVWSLEMTRTVLYILWSAAFVAVLLTLRKMDRDLGSATRILHVLGICLVSVALWKTGLSEMRGRRVSAARLALNVLPAPLPQRATGRGPDIYYFVLDGYARSDVLKETYHYDNADFLGGLKSRGFRVLRESRSNYAQTELSLASTLNMDYLQKILRGVDAGTGTRWAVDELISSNRVVASLRPRGYKVVSFRSGFDPSDLTDADVYIAERSRTPLPSGMSQADFSLAQAWKLNAFQSILVESTPLPVFLPIVPHPAIKYLDPYEAQRRNILLPFTKLAEVARLPSPKFVFIHVLAPHPPFVFGRNGEMLRPDYRFTLSDGSHYLKSNGAAPEEYVAGYVGQLGFLNRKVIEGVDSILSNSRKAPVVIIQSDHGPGLHLDWDDTWKTDYRERLSNLSAYLLPGASALPYEGMSSVNSFRFIFNQYFGEHLAYQPDRSYFSNWTRPYDFLEVTCKISNCSEASVPYKGEPVSKPSPGRS